VYKDVWDPILGESVRCKCEDRNVARAVILIFFFFNSGPNWLLNREIYIPRKFPGIRYHKWRDLDCTSVAM